MAVLLGFLAFRDAAFADACIYIYLSTSNGGNASFLRLLWMYIHLSW